MHCGTVFRTPPPSQREHLDMYEKAAANAGTSSDAKKVLATMRQLYNLK